MEYFSEEFPTLKVYYKYKKLTKNQKDFISSLIHNIHNNTTSIFEFPPTLDKDYLYNSVTYSFSSQKSKKFVILTKSHEKINELMKNFLSIKQINEKFTKDFNKIQIIPYLDRKTMCINEKLLEQSSSIDFDGYCINATSSWLSNEQKCPYYQVVYFNLEYDSRDTI
jgi:Rad3-related DNA helicase